MKAGDVLLRIAEPQLMKDIVPHPAGCACGEGGNRLVWKIDPQAVQLAVFRTEFMSPFGNAVRLINGEVRDTNLLQPFDGVGAGEALRREIEKTVPAFLGLAQDGGLFFRGEKTV